MGTVAALFLILAAGPHVEVRGRQLWVEGRPFAIRGVCWNPIAKGGTHPEGVDYKGFVARDAALMREAGINTVRTYEAITDTGVLDTLLDNGIYVLNTVYAWGGADPESVLPKIEAVRDHPAVLMWLIGSEWNYNHLYVEMTQEQALERVNAVAALIRAADPSRPIATIYGELPDAATLAAMPLIDIWGINSYRGNASWPGIDFSRLFDNWAALSRKPMFLSEYGADAWNADVRAYDPTSQARATFALTSDILAHSVSVPGGVALGGTLFEWADEWWKAGTPGVHDVGGNAPGFGPYPDGTFNEEWWGVLSVDREPRPVYDALRDLYYEQ